MLQQAAAKPQQVAAKPLLRATGHEGEEVVFNFVLLGAHIVPPGNSEYLRGKVIVASAAREIVAGEQDVRAQYRCLMIGNSSQGYPG